MRECHGLVAGWSGVEWYRLLLYFGLSENHLSKNAKFGAENFTYFTFQMSDKRTRVVR